MTPPLQEVDLKIAWTGIGGEGDGASQAQAEAWLDPGTWKCMP